MPSAEFQSWLDRWEIANEREEEELRNTPPEVSLRQLEALFASVNFFGWRESLEEGQEEVRARWARMKEKYGVQK
jgi:hypothetical protein